MSNRDDGARVLVEETLEPRDRFCVEVVRGFVQQQHVGLRQQQPAKRDATLLAAGQCRDLGVPWWQSQCVRGDLELAIQFPGARGVDGILQRALFLEQGIHLVVGHRFCKSFADFVEPVDQRFRLRDAFLDVAAHVLRGIQFRLLRQVTDLDARLWPRLSFDLGVEARHDPQQRRFSGAVQPEYPDLGAREERQRDVVDDLTFRGDRLGYPIHRVNVLRHFCWVMVKVRALSGMLQR